MQTIISLPSKPKIIYKEGNTAIFEIENLYPGYGVTLGNALRRILLSSLPGAAITMVKINNLPHEFSTIPYVLENVIEILLNLKHIRFRMYSDEPQTAYIKARGEKVVTVADVETPAQLEAVNKDLVIATLTDKKAVLEIEMRVEKGLGYVSADEIKKTKVDIGTFVLDAIFSPIRNVSYEVENMRVGDRTDYNKLRLKIETDGTIVPQEAYQKAVSILVKQFQEISSFYEAEPIEAEEENIIQEKGYDISNLKISDLAGLSNRTINALMKANIKTIEKLLKQDEKSLKEIKGLGQKGIKEIIKALEKLNLKVE